MPDRFRELEQEVLRLRKINRVLMDRVERSIDCSGSDFGLFEHNILLQKHVEARTAELETLQKDLFQAQKMESVGRLAGGVAHDFNNLLQAMGGNIQLLLMNKHDDHPDADRLKTVSRAIDRAAQLVRQLLQFSRKAEVKRRRVDLNREVEEAAIMLERTIPRMIRIEKNLDSSAWPILADPVQVEQVLLNLGGNAADALPQGGRILFQTRNELVDKQDVGDLSEMKPGRYVILSVEDTGKGMDRQTMDHIFEPFFTTKDLGKGTGLGLPSVYGIVKGHGGEIICESTPDQGTTFRVFWPAMSDSIEVDVDSSAAACSLQGGNECILVVDDDDDIRELTAEALEIHGYDILGAANGEEALAIYANKGKTISMVILDLSMPGMGGHQCLQELLILDPDARILVASGYSVETRDMEINKKGAAGFIGKPFQINQLLAKVREVLDAGGEESFHVPSDGHKR